MLFDRYLLFDTKANSWKLVAIKLNYSKLQLVLGNLILQKKQMLFYFTNSSHSECIADLLLTQTLSDYQEKILSDLEGLRKTLGSVKKAQWTIAEASKRQNSPKHNLNLTVQLS